MTNRKAGTAKARKREFVQREVARERFSNGAGCSVPGIFKT